MKKLLLILTLLSISCVHQSMFLKSSLTGLPIYQCSLPQLVIIASDVPYEHLLAIENAIDYINFELGNDVLIYAGVANYKSEDIPEDLNHIVIGVLPEEEASEPYDLGDALPYLNDKGCIKGNRVRYISERLRTNSNKFHWLVRHELLHCLGLDHSLFEGDLMYRTVPDNPSHIPRLRREAVKALRNIYNLPSGD